MTRLALVLLLALALTACDFAVPAGNGDPPPRYCLPRWVCNPYVHWGLL